MLNGIRLLSHLSGSTVVLWPENTRLSISWNYTSICKKYFSSELYALTQKTLLKRVNSESKLLLKENEIGCNSYHTCNVTKELEPIKNTRIFPLFCVTIGYILFILFCFHELLYLIWKRATETCVLHNVWLKCIWIVRRSFLIEVKAILNQSRITGTIFRFGEAIDFMYFACTHRDTGQS